MKEGLFLIVLGTFALMAIVTIAVSLFGWLKKRRRRHRKHSARIFDKLL